jgi:hypothetical protein
MMGSGMGPSILGNALQGGLEARCGVIRILGLARHVCQALRLG